MAAVNQSVFVSYSSRDRERAKVFRDTLAIAGIRVWLDETELQPGTRLDHELAQGIERSDATICLVSKAAAESFWVAQEMRLAEKLRAGHRQMIFAILSPETLGMKSELESRGWNCLFVESPHDWSEFAMKFAMQFSLGPNPQKGKTPPGGVVMAHFVLQRGLKSVAVRQPDRIPEFPRGAARDCHTCTHHRFRDDPQSPNLGASFTSDGETLASPQELVDRLYSEDSNQLCAHPDFVSRRTSFVMGRTEITWARCVDHNSSGNCSNHQTGATPEAGLMLVSAPRLLSARSRLASCLEINAIGVAEVDLDVIPDGTRRALLWLTDATPATEETDAIDQLRANCKVLPLVVGDSPDAHSPLGGTKYLRVLDGRPTSALIASITQWADLGPPGSVQRFGRGVWLDHEHPAANPLPENPTVCVVCDHIRPSNLRGANVFGNRRELALTGMQFATCAVSDGQGVGADSDSCDRENPNGRCPKFQRRDPGREAAAR